MTLSLQSQQNANLSNTPNNNDFLREVFRDLIEGTVPALASFEGDPKTGNWTAQRWDAETELSPENNNYFAISAYHINGKEEIQRTKANFSGLYAIMLDDFGTKVTQSIEDLALPPSWVLETSEGNYQVGYILAEPITESAKADKLMKAFIAAELTDKGAGGPTARLARLPVGINGKHNPKFHCQMKKWHPEHRYTPEELIESFELNLDSVSQSSSKVRKAKSQIRDEIFQPAPTDNPVIEALKAKGLYKRHISDNKHDITCPWHHEHTDSHDDGAAYLEPSDNFPVGGFKCHHSHGESLSIHSLLEHLGIPLTAARMRPNIRVIPGQLHQVSHYAERVLAETGQYFQNGAGICRILYNIDMREHTLRLITGPALTTALSACASWERYHVRTKDFISIDPPERVVASLAAATDYKCLSYILGVAHQPYLIPNGTLITEEGYNKDSKLYGAFDENEYQIPTEPSRSEAEASLSRLQELVDDFPFATQHDKSATLSAILTAALRPCLPLAPMFHVQAPQIGSGKSYLCQLISAVATSKKTHPTSFPHRNEECQKVLLAELMQSPSVIEFDNLTTDILAHKSLCTILTSEMFMGRVLGFSQTVSVSTRTLFLSSGNNVGPIKDMTRRCITITLNPQLEMATERHFKRPDLMEYVHAHRARYVADALTIVRAWICAGSPKSECKNVASYGQWSDFCRQPLLWLGLPDPAQSLFEAMQSDPDKELLGRLLLSWHERFGSKPTMVRKAIEIAELGFGVNQKEGADVLYEIFQDIAGDKTSIDRQRLGLWLKRHSQRIVNNLRLVKAEGTRAAIAWQVELVK